MNQPPRTNDANSALQVLYRRRRSEIVSRLLTVGSELYPNPPVNVYHQQFAHVNDDPGLLEASGSFIDARSFFQTEELGNNTWLELALELNRIRQLFSEKSEGDERVLTHQARILWDLCATSSERRDVICCLPHHSGRTTSALLAMFHCLVETLGSVLFVSPSQNAADLVAVRAEEFLAASGWRRAITLTKFYADHPKIQEETNVGVATPQGLDELLLRRHAEFALFLSDIDLVIVDSAEEYFGTFGTHTSLVLRRLRRLLDVYGASPRFLVNIAPYAETRQHVSRLLGLDDDASHAQRIALVGGGQDSKPRPQRCLAFWGPSLRFSGDNRLTPVQSLELRLDGVKDGLQSLLNALAFVLSSAPHPLYRPESGDPANTLIVVSRDMKLTADDAHELLNVTGWHAHVVSSMNELDERTHRYDRRVLVLFGYPGSLATLLHEAAHFGEKDALLVVALGTDPLCQHLLKTAPQHAVELTVGEGAGGQSGRSLSDLGVRQEGATGDAAANLARTNQRLVVNVGNERILEAHLYRAARELNGLAGSDAVRFFGSSALRVLNTKARRFTPDTLSFRGRTETVYRVADSEDYPQIDFDCVDWDGGGPRTGLVPFYPVAEGAERVGHVERMALGSHCVPNTERMFRGRRFIVRKTGEQRCEGAIGSKLERRERLSQFSFDVAESDLLISELALNRTSDESTWFDLKIGFGPIGVSERVVAFDQCDGYSRFGEHITSVQPPRETSFRTHALLLRFKKHDLSLGTVHALKHIIKICLPLYFRFDPKELEVVLFARGEERQTSNSSWDVVAHDNHPHGDCYARALHEMAPSMWKDLFHTGYEILNKCPCSQEGCRRCLHLPDCRHGVNEDGRWRHNTQLDKKGAFDFLGRALDKNGHQMEMLLKFGASSGGRE